MEMGPEMDSTYVLCFFFKKQRCRLWSGKKAREEAQTFKIKARSRPQHSSPISKFQVFSSMPIAPVLTRSPTSVTGPIKFFQILPGKYLTLVGTQWKNTKALVIVVKHDKCIKLWHKKKPFSVLTMCKISSKLTMIDMAEKKSQVRL